MHMRMLLFGFVPRLSGNETYMKSGDVIARWRVLQLRGSVVNILLLLLVYNLVIVSSRYSYRTGSRINLRGSKPKNFPGVMTPDPPPYRPVARSFRTQS